MIKQTVNSFVAVKVKKANERSKGGLVSRRSINTKLACPVYGTVVSPVKNLIYGKSKYENILKDNSMEWDTDVEVSPGDEVYMVFIAASKALGHILNPN